jgi:hypothetical protein
MLVHRPASLAGYAGAFDARPAPKDRVDVGEIHTGAP